MKEIKQCCSCGHWSPHKGRSWPSDTIPPNGDCKVKHLVTNAVYTCICCNITGPAKQKKKNKVPIKNPEMCCTCANWLPEENFIKGICSIIGTGDTNYGHKCGDWKDCDNEKDKSAVTLAYK